MLAGRAFFALIICCYFLFFLLIQSRRYYSFYMVRRLARSYKENIEKVRSVAAPEKANSGRVPIG